MFVRRLRGVLVAAAIWGVAFWGLSAAFLLGMLIVGADAPAPILRGLIDVAPTSLAMGGVAGAAFAVILSALGRKQPLTTLSKARVGRWGFVAGLLTAVGFRMALGGGSEPLLAWHNAYFALCLAGTSAYLAGTMLDVARRAVNVGPEMDGARP
jgi:hypothetical protein